MRSRSLGDDESFPEEEDERLSEEEEPGSDVEPTAVLPVVEPHAGEDDDKLR